MLLLYVLFLWQFAQTTSHFAISAFMLGASIERPPAILETLAIFSSPLRNMVKIHDVMRICVIAVGTRS